MRRRRFARLNLTPLDERSTPAVLFTVNSTADTNVRDTGLTLREALLLNRGDLVPTALTAGEAAKLQFNGGTGTDAIVFAPALGGQTITLAANDTAAANRYGATGFVVTTAVTLDGSAGSGPGVTLSGGGTERLFAVAPTGNLTVTNLDLVNGRAAGGNGVPTFKAALVSGGGGGAGLGGAVFVDQGTLTVTASTLTGNKAAGGAGGTRTTNTVGASGGGLLAAGGPAVGGGPNGGAYGTTIQAGGAGGFGGGGGAGYSGALPSGGNGTFNLPGTAGGAGGFGGGGGAGGIARTGTVFSSGSGLDSQTSYNLTSATIRAGGPGGFGGGGAGAGASMVAVAGGFGGAPNSGFNGGGGAGFGGAIFNNAGTVTVRNSTLAANTATAGGAGAAAYGGAIFSRNGTLSITSTTLSANTAASGGTGVAVLADGVLGGGGDVANTGTAAFDLTASVLGGASNSTTDLVTLTNGAGAAVTVGGTANAIRNTTVGGLDNQTTADPLLGPLQDNGGPTPTMAPAATSPVVDAGALATGAATDQRGTGFARVVDGRLDLGAVELQSLTTPAVLTPAALPGGYVGIAYAGGTIAAAGPPGPFTFAVTAGTLPAGLSLTAAGGSTAIVSGTPTAAGNSTFTVTASNGAGGTGSRQFTVAIGTAPVFGPATLPAGTQGTAYTAALGVTGAANASTFALAGGALPTGLNLSAAGVISGTPTATGPFSFTASATSPQLGTLTHDFTIVVNLPVVVGPAALPGGRATVAYDQTLTAAGPLGPYTFAVSAGSLPAGLTLSTAGELSGTPTAAGTSAFTVTATNAAGLPGSRAYVVTVGPAPVVTVGPAALPDTQGGAAYDQTFTAAGEAAPYTFSLAAGVLPPGLDLSAAGRLVGTPTTPGTYPFTVRATSADGFPGTRDYSILVNPPVVVGPDLLPDTVVTLAYDQTLTAAGPPGPYTFALSAGSLPPGLALSTAGELSGTPTTIGDYPFTVTATSAAGYTASRDYDVAVVAPGVVTIRPAALPPVQVATAYGQTLTASGEVGPYTFAVTAGQLPPGLALTLGGVVSGTPVAVGDFPFTVTATSPLGFSGRQDFTIEVVPPVAITPAGLPGGRRTIPYAQVLTASGPAGPYTFTVTGGALPPGLALSTAGNLTGTPAVGGTFGFTVTAANGEGFAGHRDYAVTIGAAPLVTVGPSTLPAAQAGEGYAQPLTASGEAAPYTFTVVSGRVPAGLTVSPAGAVTGTPTAAGTYAFTVAVTSADGFTGSQLLTLQVNPPTTVGPGALAVGVVGTAYHQTTTAGPGGPYAFTVTAGALPPGLALSATGDLAGTPTAAGTYAFTVTAAATGLTGRRAYSLVVVPPVVLAPAALPGGSVGGAYDRTLTASGPVGPYTFGVVGGSLPPGLALSTAGELAGTPTAAGAYTFTVAATSADGYRGTLDYSVGVAAVVVLGSDPLPGGVVGSAYAGGVTATGATGPYTYRVTAGSLPPGLSLADDGAVAGTPAAAGTFAFAVAARSADGVVGERSYALTVAPRPIVIVAPAALAAGQVGAAYSQTVSATGAAGPYTFAVAGELPAGLVLAADGTLSGTALQAGTFAFTVTAESADGFTGAQPYSIAVAPAITFAPATLVPARVGDAYDQTLSAAGPAGPYTFAVAAGAVPPGLTLSPTGALRGTPTASGTFTFVVQATTPDGSAGRQDYTAVVAPAVVAPSPPVPPPPLPPPSVPVAGANTAVGLSDGTLTVLGPDGRPVATLAPFSDFAGEVRAVALPGGRVAVGTGPGRATAVKVIDPATGVAAFDLAPFEPAFTGGVFVSAGDLFGTGTPQLAISPDEGGGPRVRIIDPATGAVRLDFFGIDDPAFRGGARTAIDDVTGDGVPDLIVAAGFGGGPRVTVWDGASLRAGTPVAVANFFVFEPTLRNGVYVAAGDLDGDGFADPVFGGGPGGGPRVLALSGRDVAAGAASPAAVANFFAGDTTNRGGVPLAVKDTNGDGRPDVVTGGGPGTRGTVRTFSGPTLGRPQPDELFEYDPPAAVMNGVYVG